MPELTLERDRFGTYRIPPTQLAECFAFIICEQEELLQIIVTPSEDQAIVVMQLAMKMHAPHLAVTLTDRLWREIYRILVRYARHHGIPTFYDFYTGALEPLPPTLLKPPSKRLIRAFRHAMARDAKKGS
jgi:hypothetical protein